MAETSQRYSTMCGHATIAIARLVVDSLPSGFLDKFLDRSKLHFDVDKQELRIPIHVPCGLVQATVPCVQTGGNNDLNSLSVDASQPISYLGVPSYAPALNVRIPVPAGLRWPELGERDHITADVTYGGAFYIVLPAAELGFSPSLANPDHEGLTRASRSIKKAFNSSEELRTKCLDHPDHKDLQFLYGTIVTDPNLGAKTDGSIGAETSICFFSDAQVDRSPTGSGVQARVALAYARGERKIDHEWTYHSPVSNAFGEGGFVGSAVEEVDFSGRKAVVVKVAGYAKYTGAATYVVEEGDSIGKGFWFDELEAQQ